MDIVDICVPRRDDDNSLMGPPIIELEFEKCTLNPHIIIGEERIQLRMKKKQLYVKSASKLGTQKNSAEATENSSETAQKEEYTIDGWTFSFTANNLTRHETRKYVENIQQREREEKREETIGGQEEK